MAVTPSGKDKLLRWTRLYVGGYDLSGDWRNPGTLENAYEQADMTGISEVAYNYLGGGSRMVGIRGTQVLMNDTATTGAFTLLKSGNNASQVVITLGGGGEPAVGDPAYHIPTRQLVDTVSMDGGGAVMTANFLQDALQYNARYDCPFGVTLRGATSLSATLTASSANSVDFGAQQSGVTGWSAMLQVLSTSAGNFAFTIADSLDDAAFSTIGTFVSTGGAIGSELLTGTDTVERYVAFNAVRTAGTVTVVVTFVRNGV